MKGRCELGATDAPQAAGLRMLSLHVFATVPVPDCIDDILCRLELLAATVARVRSVRAS